MSEWIHTLKSPFVQSERASAMWVHWISYGIIWIYIEIYFIIRRLSIEKNDNNNNHHRFKRAKHWSAARQQPMWQREQSWASTVESEQRMIRRILLLLLLLSIWICITVHDTKIITWTTVDVQKNHSNRLKALITHTQKPYVISSIDFRS